MNSPPRIAVAGAGYFAQFHLEAWKGLEREGIVVLAALAEPDEAKRAAAAARYDISRQFDDATQMLDTVQPDLFDIVTPPPPHAGLVAMAHARGIPVICQKPMAPSWAEAAALTAYHVMRVGIVPLIPYYRPGDTALAQAVGALASRHRALLLAKHGPVVAGSSLDAAVDSAEELEQTARLTLLLAGRDVAALTTSQVAEIEAVFVS